MPSDSPLTQPRTLPLNITQDLCAGKTYIVTGANVGLGLEAARHLVAIGASKVIMAVRNLDAGAAARADIESSTGTKGVAEVWHLDLSSNASVKSFASKAMSLERIEAIIENAAVAAVKDPAKIEGHHPQLTVNVVNTFLLAVMLLPKLRADAAKFDYRPRVSVVSSGAALDMGDFWSTVAGDPIKKMDESKDAGMKL